MSNNFWISISSGGHPVFSRYLKGGKISVLRRRDSTIFVLLAVPLFVVTKSEKPAD
jgi:hypothetical protein